ncbi:MAG: hypothetical protein H0W21_07745 [Actinobacteria bacterium]|nr:hypothetical protein [Actinomycetota bacterium]
MGKCDAHVGSGGLALHDLLLELLGQSLDPLLGKLHLAIDLPDHRLAIRGKHVRLTATGSLAKGVSLPEAVEVQVLALGPRQGQAIATLPAA